MLDWFSSKIAMIAAVLILTIAVVGFFNNETSNLSTRELENIANGISGAINNMANIKAETRLKITFDESENGVYIRPTVRGEAYTINLTQDLVILKYDDITITSKIISPIHLWNVSMLDSSKNLSSSEVREYDSAYSSRQFPSGTDFLILNRLLNIDGKETYFTFISVSN